MTLLFFILSLPAVHLYSLAEDVCREEEKLHARQALAGVFAHKKEYYRRALQSVL
jgi:hypothetical protein